MCEKFEVILENDITGIIDETFSDFARIYGERGVRGVDHKRGTKRENMDVTNENKQEHVEA